MVICVSGDGFDVATMSKRTDVIDRRAFKCALNVIHTCLPCSGRGLWKHGKAWKLLKGKYFSE